MESWKTKTLIIGGILGAIFGTVAAYMMIQRAEEKKQRPHLTAGDGVKVGLGVLGVLRLIADMGTSKS